MSIPKRHLSANLPLTLATHVAQQTPYSLDQALRGVYGILSCYEDTSEASKAIEEFIQCMSE